MMEAGKHSSGRVIEIARFFTHFVHVMCLFNLGNAERKDVCSGNYEGRCSFCQGKVTFQTKEI